MTGASDSRSRRDNRCHTNYSACYEGGWQDVLPARARWDGGAICEGIGVGEAAIVPWDVTRSLCTPAAAHVICHASPPRTRLNVMQRFGIRRGVPALRVETTVRNASSRDVWLNWTQHPALGGDLLNDTSRVFLPGGRPRVTRDNDGHHAHNNGDGHGDVTRRAPEGARWVDATAVLPPASASADRFQTFAGVERGEAALLSRARGVGVRQRWDKAFFPHVWLWCARSDAIACVAVEPSTTDLPESIPDGSPEILHLLRRGESLHTWVELSTFAPPPPAGDTAA